MKKKCLSKISDDVLVKEIEKRKKSERYKRETEKRNEEREEERILEDFSLKDLRIENLKRNAQIGTGIVVLLGVVIGIIGLVVWIF